MELKNNAQWHIDLNGGVVPILETPDGTLIHESAVIMNMATDKDQGKGMKLWPHELRQGDVKASVKTAAMRLEMLAFDKLFMPFWGCLFSQFNDMEKVDSFKENVPKMEELFVRNLNGADYLSGTSQPMMIDLHCYPMVERMVMLKDSPLHIGFEVLGMEEAPAMCAFVHRFRAHPTFKDHVITQDNYFKLLTK